MDAPPTLSTPRTLLRAILLGAGAFILFVLSACSGSGLRVEHVPSDGYFRTINYQFQAQLHLDETGRCRKMVVRVRPLNKGYSEGEPPPRLQFFDDDCASPLRFERAQFVSREGTQVQLYGTEVTRYLGQFNHLENELVGWLWREGMI